MKQRFLAVAVAAALFGASGVAPAVAPGADSGENTNDRTAPAPAGSLPKSGDAQAPSTQERADPGKSSTGATSSQEATPAAAAGRCEELAGTAKENCQREESSTGRGDGTKGGGGVGGSREGPASSGR